MIRFSKIALVIAATAFLFNIFLPLNSVSAQALVSDPIVETNTTVKNIRDAKVDVKETVEKAKDTWLDKVVKALQRAGMVAYKNALRTFLSRLAVDTATRLAEGGLGKSPLFDKKAGTAFLSDVVDTTLADTMDILASDNGFFNFDVCQPQNLNLSFSIHYSLIGNFSGRGARGKPRCSLSQIAKSWDDWATNIGRTFQDSDKFLDSVRNMFKPEQGDVGIYLAADSALAKKVAEKLGAANVDKIASQGFKDVTESISGYIKTPAKVSAEAAAQLKKDAPIAETVSTGDIVADSLGIFTNTLASKLLKQLFTKGLGGEAQQVRSLTVYNWAVNQVNRSSKEQFASLASITPSSGVERVIDTLTQCPDPNNPGPNDCVINQQLVAALEQGLTVKEALKQNYLNGNSLVGYKALGNLDYTNGYSYRSLVIMRINRLIPASWELAALYNIKNTKEKTLQQIVDCYDKADQAAPDYDSNCDPKQTGKNIYYHLIDPNWVLKAPESFCARKGFGHQIISSEQACIEDNVPNTSTKGNTPQVQNGPACDLTLDNPDKPVLTVTRATDYCADRKTCLREDDKGNCVDSSDIEKYGYCVSEQSFWRFQGDSCQPLYSSCETFTVAGKEMSVLRDTLQLCGQNDTGCKWYATSQVRQVANNEQQMTWRPEAKIYLNSKAETCSEADGGCTNVSRLMQGVNLAFNGDFELDNNHLEGWEASDNCILSAVKESFNNSFALKAEANGNCEVSTKIGQYIPIDPRYGLVVGGYAKAETAGNLRIRIFYYGGNKQQIGNPYATTTSIGTSWAEPFKAELPVASTTAQYARIGFIANGNAWYDNIQLAVSKSYILRHNDPAYSFNPQSYIPDYSQNSSYYKQYLKVAPSYLSCEGFNNILFSYETNEKGRCLTEGHYWRADLNKCVESGDATCSKYAAFCSAEEVGCQGYQPENGDPEVSARTAQGDLCDAQCVGYESYLQTTDFFDTIANPNAEPEYQNFIPDTAKQCTAADAGCEEFTNLDEVAKGGEGKEYFIKLRQCISQANPNLTVYYTWEGSDTTGYQLKKWDLLRSGIDGYNNETGIGPCTNIAIGTEDCRDDRNQNLPAVCYAEELANNPDCRDFFNAAGNHYLRLQPRTITASGECHPYRRSLTNEIYNADPAEGQSCSASVNNCREYKGNQGNNVRTIFSANFEDGTSGGFTNFVGNNSGVTNSTEAIQQGGHSLQIAVHSNWEIYHDLTGRIKDGQDYILTFWAKKTNGGNISLVGSQLDVPVLEFTQEGLTNDWQVYQIGPVVANNQPTYLKIIFANLADDEVVYLDNIILKEYTSSFYVIKDSWVTKDVCNTPYVGAELGCKLYNDRQGQSHYLKSFDYLCKPEAIACEAYVDTRNSTDAQAEKIYHEAENPITVPNDQIIYLVNDPAKQCNSGAQGCSALGSPLINQQIDPALDADNNGIPDAISGYETVYYKNNPDDYEIKAILCGASGESCENFEGALTSTDYYFNPSGKAGDKVCEYKGGSTSGDGGKWVIVGTDTDCPGVVNGNGKMATSTEQGYAGWVGMCPTNQSSCTQFTEINPLNPAISKPYYYLDNESLDKTSCTAEDKNGDCIKFTDHSLGDTPFIKVRRDRQCNEWLECASSFETTDANGLPVSNCLSLTKCYVAEDGINKVCTANSGNVDGIYNLADNDLATRKANADAVGNLSGYAHPGATWASTDVTGYKSPEKMSQIGKITNIVNGNFERYLNNMDNVEGWIAAATNSENIASDYNDGNCAVTLDNDVVHSGRYSLEISRNRLDDQRVCIYRTTGQAGYFTVNEDNVFSLTFYAKSQNGAQKARAGLYWYDGGGIPCNEANGYCRRGQPHADANGNFPNDHPTGIAGQEGPGGATVINIQPPAGNWQKYTLTVGGDGNALQVPDLARYFRLYITAHSTYGQEGAIGSLWFDDFTLEPKLLLNNQGSISSRECRLYPKQDAPVCDYADIKQYEGWKGYCLEPDPFYQPDQLDPSNWDKCLQWYPVDSIQGDRISVFNVDNTVGYADRSPLYYCAQSAGNYGLGRVDSGPGAFTSGFKVQSKVYLDTRSGDTDDLDSPCNDWTGNSRNIYACAIYSDQEGGDNSDYKFDSSVYCTRDNNNLVCQINKHPTWPDVDGYDEDDWDIRPDTSNTGDRIINTVDNEINYEDLVGVYLDTIINVREQHGNKRPIEKILQPDIDGFLEKKDYSGNVTYFSTHWSNGQPAIASCQSTPEIRGDWSLKIKFAPIDGVKKITEIYFLACANGNRDDGNDSEFDVGAGVQLDISYVLNESCRYIAQTVSSVGGRTEEKTFLSRFNNWTNESNQVKFSKNLNKAPYGSFIAPRQSTPDYWHIPIGDRSDAPLYVYAQPFDANDQETGTFDFGPPAGVPWSVTSGRRGGRSCSASLDNSKIGTACSTSGQCDGTGTPGKGVCSGIGKYCFLNGSSVMTGKACKDEDGDNEDIVCGDSANSDCKLPVSGNIQTTPAGAISRLQDLYAKIYGVWKWTGTRYALCLPFGNYDCGLGNDINAMDVSRTVGEAITISSNAAAVSNYRLKAPSQGIQAEFYLDANGNQLPIDNIWIIWGDGQTDYFQGPLNDRPMVSRVPFKASHIYSCTTDANGKCTACNGGVDAPTPDANGNCNYGYIKVDAKDHWGFCGTAADNVSAGHNANYYTTNGICPFGNSGLGIGTGPIIIGP